LRGNLFLFAVACGSLLAFAGDASACHRGWHRTRCHSSSYYQACGYRTYSYPTYVCPQAYYIYPACASYATTYTYPTTYTYAPAPVYAAPQTPAPAR
jgi:hypothetical protein